jgi:hypothetical protein
VKRTRGRLCSAENSDANAMMPDQNVNAGRGSSILLYKTLFLRPAVRLITLPVQYPPDQVVIGDA